MPTSVRLDAETEALLQRLVRKSGRTKSDMLRDVLHAFANDRAGSGEVDGVYVVIADLVGIATGGPIDLARGHKQAFRRTLAKGRRRYAGHPG